MVRGFAVITSARRVAAGSRPSPMTRKRASRSVKMPASRPSCTTRMAPMRCSFMSRAAAATVVSAAAVTGFWSLMITRMGLSMPSLLCFLLSAFHFTLSGFFCSAKTMLRSNNKSGLVAGEREAANPVDRRVGVVAKHHAVEACRAAQREDAAPEVQAQRDFGKRAVGTAHRDEAESGARDDGVARLADTGGYRHRHVRVGVAGIGTRQQSDREAPLRLGAAADRFHHTLPAPADDGETDL